LVIETRRGPLVLRGPPEVLGVVVLIVLITNELHVGEDAHE